MTHKPLVPLGKLAPRCWPGARGTQACNTGPVQSPADPAGPAAKSRRLCGLPTVGDCVAQLSLGFRTAPTRQRLERAGHD